MKLAQASKLLLLAGVCDAFAPAKFGARRGTARSLAIDPSVMQEIPNHVHSLQAAFSSMSLSDALAAIPDASSLMDAAPAAGDVADAAAEASSNGWFGILTEPIEVILQLIHSSLVSMGVTENAWGVSIIGITLLIKLLTFPLTKTQLEGTNKMQVSIVIIFFACRRSLPFLILTSLLSRHCNQNSRKSKQNTKAIQRS
jgi:hypothetical protein